MDCIDVKTLQVPVSSFTESDLSLYKYGGAIKRWPKSPILINHEINSRVVLYYGDIELLSAEAIVNPTTEGLSQLNYVSSIAGCQLEDYIRKKVRNCPTGDVRVTPGFESNYKYIIHAVPPKYQPKYQTAAETALFQTYFRILETMIEKKIRTVVMPILSTTKSNFPVEDNCHLQMRIIRRILEKKLHEFDRIVIHVDDVTAHLATFLSYFPRTDLDEAIASYHLPSSLGGVNGEPVIPEREIRIKSKPGANLGQTHDNSIDLTSGLDLSTVVGKTAFSRMRDDMERQMKAAKSKRNNNFFSGSKSCHSNQVAVRRKSVFKGCILF